MEINYIDSLRNKLFQLETSLEKLKTDNWGKIIEYISNEYYPGWVDLDAGLVSIEESMSSDEVTSMRIRLNASQVKVLHLVNPAIEMAIDEIKEEQQVQTVFSVIRIIEQISRKEASSLNINLQKKRKYISIKKTADQLHAQGKEIYKQFLGKLKDEEIPQQEKLSILENLLVNEEKSLQNVKNSLAKILEDADEDYHDLQNLYSDINEWYGQCKNEITPFRRTMDDLPTYLESEDYEESARIIRDAKSTSSVGQVNSYVDDDLENRDKALMDVNKAELIFIKRWKKFSIAKYIKYQNDVENRLGRGNEDPRDIERDFAKNTSNNLMPIDDLDWDVDQKKTFMRVLDQLNRQVIFSKNSDQNIDKAVQELNPIMGFRLLKAEYDQVKNKPYFDSKYQNAYTNLTGRCVTYTADHLKEIRIIYENNPQLSIASQKISNLQLEIASITELEDQGETLSQLKQIISDSIDCINRLSADPNQAFTSLSELKQGIEEKGFSIPFAVRQVMESCQSAINPQETVQQLLDQSIAPTNKNEINEHGINEYQQRIAQLQNALSGIEETQAMWQTGEDDRRRKIDRLKREITCLSAARDYLYVQEEFERDKKDIIRIRDLLNSAENLPFLLEDVSTLRQRTETIQTADNQINALIQQIDRSLRRQDIQTESLLRLFNNATDLEDQPSYLVPQLFAAKLRVQKNLERKLTVELKEFCRSPKKFVERLDEISMCIDYVHAVGISFEGNLEGALDEGKAWKSIKENTRQESNWDRSLYYWTQAEIHHCINARFHRFCSLKALAIADAEKGNFSSLQRARREPILKMDSELSILAAQSRFFQLEKKFSDPVELIQIAGTSEFNKVLTDISFVLGLESAAENGEEEQSMDSEIDSFNQIWNEFYSRRVPPESDANSLYDLVQRRKKLFDDFLLITKKLRIDSSLREFQSGISLEKATLKELESRDLRNKQNKQEYSLFSDLCASFRTFTLHELKK